MHCTFSEDPCKVSKVSVPCSSQSAMQAISCPRETSQKGGSLPVSIGRSCSIALCSMQDSVVQSAGLPAMVQMLALPDDERRCSAMWALANLIHAASPAVCDAVMAALPWNQFVPLLQDTSSCVQVSSLAQAWLKEATMYQTNASQAMFLTLLAKGPMHLAIPLKADVVGLILYIIRRC